VTKIFIDTDALIALNDASDLLHNQAVDILTKIDRRRILPYLSTNILLEVLTLISQRVSKAKALRLLDEFRAGEYVIVHPGERVVDKAEEIFRSVKSKNVSYSDCMSFAIMQDNNIEWVFSFDVHFKKQGFKRVGIEGFPAQ